MGGGGGGGNLAPALVGEKRPGIEVVLGEEQLTPTSPRWRATSLSVFSTVKCHPH